MINEQTVKDIHGALLVIKQRGWTQGKYESEPGGPVCLTGALRVAIFGDAYPRSLTSPEQWTRLYYAQEVIGGVVNRSKIESFNDSKDTKRRHVIRALKQAEAKASKL